MRARRWQALWLALLLPLQAAALSLGDMVVRSVPGEPLRAHIPLTLAPGEALAEVRITLADAAGYQQRHLPRAGMLQGLRLGLLDRGEGKARLQLFGESAWQGEEALLLLLVDWPAGQLEQQFRLAPVVAAGEAAPLYVEGAADETLDAIAMRLSKGRNRSYLHMMYALFLANPDAFYRGNMNNLKSGQTLRVPNDEELYRFSDREVFDGIRRQYEQWQQLREPAQRGTQAGEALAGMSAEQADALDLSGDSTALQQRLRQVAEEGEALRRENEALQQRLQALEQRMQRVAGQVLEYAGEGVQAPAPAAQQPTVSPPPAEKPSVVEGAKPALDKGEKSQPPEEAEEGLSASTMFAALLIVVLFVVYIWYSTGHPHRWRS